MNTAIRMKKFFTIVFLAPLLFIAQNYEGYGPLGAEVYKDLKTALKIGDGVYKLDLSYQELVPKLWNKIGKLRNLQVLHLSANTGPVDLPEGLGKLTNLVYFCSVGNKINAFPEFKNWGSLMHFEIMGSSIDSIPNDIAYLQRLKVFKFTATDDSLKLTKNLRLMKNLNTLVLESVILDSCPRVTFRIENLKVLSLKNCGIQAIPENLEKAAGLESLNLDNNKLTRLPREIYKMKNLTVLSLRNNKLSKIPDTICHLQNLSVLDLRGNYISKTDIEELEALLYGCKVLY